MTLLDCWITTGSPVMFMMVMWMMDFYFVVELRMVFPKLVGVNCKKFEYEQ